MKKHMDATSPIKGSARRTYDDNLKSEAVKMLLDGHSAESIAKNLGISGPHLIYRWRAKDLQNSGTVGVTLQARVRQLEAELQRVERERDILKKALAIFSQKT